MQSKYNKNTMNIYHIYIIHVKNPFMFNKKNLHSHNPNNNPFLAKTTQKNPLSKKMDPATIHNPVAAVHQIFLPQLSGFTPRLLDSLDLSTSFFQPQLGSGTRQLIPPDGISLRWMSSCGFPLRKIWKNYMGCF